MAVIRLTILALLVNGLLGNDLNRSNNTDLNLTEELNITLTASSTPMPLTSSTTMTTLNASEPKNDLPSTASDLTSTFSNTSQTVFNHSSEPSVSSSASPSTLPVTNIDRISKSVTSTTVRKSTINKGSKGKGKGTNLNASMIIACIIGGLLLFMVVVIIVILLVKRCSRNYNVQDTPWAGTCPGVISNDPEHPDEGCDAPAKRPSLISFLSKKGKHDSLLENYSMVQATEGVNNLASSETEEKALSADVKGDNEIVKEPPALAKTTSQEFPPLLEEHDIQDEADPQPPLPATDTETSKLSGGLTDADSKYFDLPPPQMDIVDLVNNSDLPPPL